MNLYRKIGIIALVLVLIVSCKKSKTKKLIGTWNVTEISISAIIIGIPFTETDSNPSGTITFKNGGQGAQNYTFKFLNDTVNQDDNFTWRIKGKDLITGTNDKWERITNKQKLQKVKYTDSISASDIRTYTITMTK